MLYKDKTTGQEKEKTTQHRRKGVEVESTTDTRI